MPTERTNKFHIWKPEPDRWIVIDTHTGQLFDVGRNGNGYSSQSISVVPKDVDLAGIVGAFEAMRSPSEDLIGHGLLDFAVE